MKRRTSFRELHDQGLPLIIPSAHDGLSAKLIALAGFRAMAASGSGMLAARYGLPDLGIAGLADMEAVTRDVIAATDLPCIADGDDGYGDVKSVARTVRITETLGVGALVLEDQSRSVKRPGQAPAHAVVPEDEILAKLRVAVQTRDSADFWVFGRTDSYATLGLDGALRRGDAFLRNGVDGLFIAGVRTEEDLVKVGRTFAGIPLIVVVYNSPGWPFLAVSDLHDLGFTQIVYPLALILPVCAIMAEVLQDLKETTDKGGAPMNRNNEQHARAILHDALETSKWQAIGDASVAPL